MTSTTTTPSFTGASSGFKSLLNTGLIVLTTIAITLLVVWFIGHKTIPAGSVGFLMQRDNDGYTHVTGVLAEGTHDINPLTASVETAPAAMPQNVITSTITLFTADNAQAPFALSIKLTYTLDEKLALAALQAKEGTTLDPNTQLYLRWRERAAGVISEEVNDVLNYTTQAKAAELTIAELTSNRKDFIADLAKELETRLTPFGAHIDKLHTLPVPVPET